MNDIGVSGASSGADIVAAAKGSRTGKQDDGKGFLDALASSLGDGRKSSGTNVGTGATQTANDNTDGDAGTTTVTAGNPALAVDGNLIAGGSMIDTSVANIANLAKGAKSLQGAGPLSLSKSLIELQKAAQAMADADPSATDASAADANDPAAAKPDVSQLPAQADAAAQLVEIAQQLAEAAGGGQVLPTDGNGKAPATKGDKGTSTTDDGKSAPTQSAQTANTITDALSILNVAQTVAAAQDAAVAGGQARSDAKVQGVTISSAGLKEAATDAGQAMPGDSATADTAQTFRLARADGRNGALEMSIAKRGDDAADIKISAPAGGDAQAVTVLESRRYLGLANNSALVAGSLAGDREWSAAMQPGSALSNAANLTSTGKVVNTLKIQLSPDNLGDVTATMRLSGDQLTVDLKVQTGEAYRQLHADQSHMIDALRAQGYQVDSITVTLASSTDQQSDGNRQSGSNQQQQSLLNQGQGGDARPRGQNFSGQQADGSNGNRSSSERGLEDGAGGGVQRSRSGAVYL